MPDFYTGLIALIEDIRQKDTSPAFDSDTDSLEAIRERIDALAGATWSTETLVAIKSVLDARAAEATLTAMKGAGWSAETLKAIYDALIAMRGAGWSDETLVAIKAAIDAFSAGGGIKTVAASDSLLNSNDAKVITTAMYAYDVLKETIVGVCGKIRVKFDITPESSGYYAYGKIYVNSVAVGTERTSTGTAGWSTFSEDINVDVGDRIQIYAKTENSGIAACVRNFRLYGTLGDNFANTV